jgi:hypothetical protein
MEKVGYPLATSGLLLHSITMSQKTIGQRPMDFERIKNGKNLERMKAEATKDDSIIIARVVNL